MSHAESLLQPLAEAGHVLDGIEIAMLMHEPDLDAKGRAIIAEALAGSSEDQIAEAFRHDQKALAWARGLSSAPAPTPAPTAKPLQTPGMFSRLNDAPAPAVAPAQPNPRAVAYEAAIARHLEAVNVGRSRAGKPALTKADLSQDVLASLIDDVVPDASPNAGVDQSVMAAIKGRFS